MMKIKICPNCNSHNVETAWICANTGCRQTLLNVNVVEVNDNIVRLIEESNEHTQSSDVNSGSSQTNITPREESKSKSFGSIKGFLPIVDKILIVSVVFFCIALLLFRVFYSNDSTDSLTALIFLSPVVTILCSCLVPIVLWLWPLIDCIRNEPSVGNDKIVWTLIILFTGFIGGALYLLIRRSQRIAAYGR